jgi:hypothetical protein
MCSQISRPFFHQTIALWLIASSFAISAEARVPCLKLDSPFLPPFHGQIEQNPKSTIQPLKINPNRFVLRGVSNLAGNYIFSIYDNEANKAKWVEAGVSSNGFTITSYDPIAREITYSWEGHEGTVQLVDSDSTAVSLAFSNTPLPTASGERNQGPIDATRNRSVSRSQERVTFEPVSSDQVPLRTNGSTIERWSRFSSKEQFAQLNPDTPNDTHSPSLDDKPAATPYKVSRRNNVHNPTFNRKPDHMPYADWIALTHGQN